MCNPIRLGRSVLCLQRLAFTVALLAGDCGVSNITSAPTDVSARVDELFQKIDDGTFDSTYDTATTPEFRKVTTKEAYAKIGEAVKTRLGRLKSKTTSRMNVRVMNGVASADATYNATFDKGSGTIATRFRKTGEEWKLLALRVDSPVFQQDVATLTCADCGAAHTATAKFCPGCGVKLGANATSEKADDKTENKSGPPSDTTEPK